MNVIHSAVSTATKAWDGANTAYLMAAINQDDGTSGGVISNLVSNLLAALAVIALGITGVLIVKDMAGKGANNEKIKNIGMTAVIGIAVAGLLAYIPKMSGMGDNFVTGFLS